MINSIHSFLNNVQNNQMVMLLFSGGIIWTVFSNIRSIFTTIWDGILACISFTVNSVNLGEYDTPTFHIKMTRLLSDSKVLWERHTEIQSSTGEYGDNHLSNSAYGRSLRWMFGHFMILDRFYSTQSTKVVVTVTARIFFANRKKFLAKLMKEIENYSLTSDRDTINVSMGNGIATEKPKRSIGSIYSNDGTPERILKDVRAFIENRDMYIKGNSPYKFVGLLTGTPGTGKSSAIHAIASELGMGVRFVDTDDEEFKDVARLMVRNGEYSGETNRNIIVIEDVDCMSMSASARRALPGMATPEDYKINDGDSDGLIDAKRSAARACGVVSSPITAMSLSSILNLLDGIITPSGCIVFLTSNNPEKLDEALLRDGRIDGRYEFSNFNKETANKLVKDYLGYEIENIRDNIVPSSLQRDVMKVNMGRMEKSELVEKYTEV